MKPIENIPMCNCCKAEVGGEGNTYFYWYKCTLKYDDGKNYFDGDSPCTEIDSLDCPYMKGTL